jgi:hypothetical protein
MKAAALTVAAALVGIAPSPAFAASKKAKRVVAAPVAPAFPSLFPGFNATGMKPFGFFSTGLSAPSNVYAALPGSVQSPVATRGGPSTSTACLPGELRSALADVQSRFGPVVVVSTHRPGARIGGGHMSKHANCQAVDFRPAPGTYAAVANHLRQTWNGGLGTYSSGHIHIDTGANYRWHTGGGKRRG